MTSREAKRERIRSLMASEGDAVFENTTTFNRGRYESVAGLEDYEELKAEAREIKEAAIEDLPALVDEVTAAVEANGGTVYLADDAADARSYIGDVVEDRGAKSVVKSKSMTSEEIDVNDHLEAAEVDVWETDLGEFVLQVAEEAPSHIVAPAIHKSRAEIARLFDQAFDPDEPLETAADLTAFASDYLDGRIRKAEVAMTGANFVAADTGTMALVTSEGNARKCVASTDTHVAIAGVEKLVPSVTDLQPFVELIGRSGTGQDITAYVSMLTPPVDTPVPGFDDGERPLAPAKWSAEESAGELATPPSPDRDFHLVLLDNGRTALRDDDQLRETLYCIRCSACLNSCANFQHVGGHAFGGETYSGGIGTGWEYGVHGVESAADFNDLCTGCSRCVNQCPVGIDIPWINTVVRDRRNRSGDPAAHEFLVDGLTPDEESAGMDLQKRFFGNFETVARLGSALAPVSNWLAALPPSRWAMQRVLGIDRRRDLPTFERETFRSWFETRGHALPAGDASREAVVYPDVYTNYVAPARGKAAVRTLEALNVHVRIPDAGETGRAPLSQGMVATAESRASETYGALAEHVDAGRDVVVIEPSDLAMFRDDYERLLPTASTERLREASYEVMEYVFGLVENGGETACLSGPDGDPSGLAYHAHCQQRTLGLAEYTVAVLEGLGYDVATSDVECCGMAGSFGYKREYYDLAMDVGADLAGEFAADGMAERRVVASGTSCLDQLDALLDRRPSHPVQVIAPD
jgi:L-lactate utilization protein LutB